MPHMSEDEVDAFLEDSIQLSRMATVDEGGHPYVQPMWFLRDGDRLLVSPREQSRWLAHIRNDPRVCLSIDEQTLPHRKVTIRGVATIEQEIGTDAEWLETYRRIVHKYWDPQPGNDYIESTKHLSRALVSIPYAYGAEGVTNWRSILEGDDYAGIWASRYWKAYTPGREAEGGPSGAESVPTSR